MTSQRFPAIRVSGSWPDPKSLSCLVIRSSLKMLYTQSESFYISVSQTFITNARGEHRSLKSSGSSQIYVTFCSCVIKMLNNAVKKYKQTTILYCNMSTIWSHLKSISERINNFAPALIGKPDSWLSTGVHPGFLGDFVMGMVHCDIHTSKKYLGQLYHIFKPKQ